MSSKHIVAEKALKLRRFLEAYAICGRKEEAAETVELHWRHIDYEIKHNKEFAAEFDRAHAKYLELLEREIHRRAVDGVEEPVYYLGQKVGTIKKYSDALLLAKAKREIPEYREKHETNVKISGQVLIVPMLPTSEEQFEQMAEQERKRLK